MFKFHDATVLIINYCFRESIKISTQTPTTKQNNNTLFVFVKIEMSMLYCYDNFDWHCSDRSICIIVTRSYLYKQHGF